MMFPAENDNDGMHLMGKTHRTDKQEQYVLSIVWFCCFTDLELSEDHGNDPDFDAFLAMFDHLGSDQEDSAVKYVLSFHRI